MILKVKVISLPHIFQVLYVLCFTRPRYQVSVYRTIGPLVYVLCFTRPRYQVSVYRTIGPLVSTHIDDLIIYFCFVCIHLAHFWITDCWRHQAWSLPETGDVGKKLR